MAIAQEEHPVPPAMHWTWTNDPKELTGSGLRVEVSDTSNRLPAMQHPGDTDETSRGLSLVASISSRWGVAPRRVNGQYTVGKTVWFEIDHE
jgi:hypothetical protein